MVTAEQPKILVGSGPTAAARRTYRLTAPRPDQVAARSPVDPSHGAEPVAVPGIPAAGAITGSVRTTVDVTGALELLQRLASRRSGPASGLPQDLALLAEQALRIAMRRHLRPASPSGTKPAFSVVNLGEWGLDAAEGLLAPPMVTVLGLGAVRQRRGISADEAAPPAVSELSLTFDQRVVSHQVAAQVLADVAGLLADPSLALF